MLAVAVVIGCLIAAIPISFLVVVAVSAAAQAVRAWRGGRRRPR